MQFDKGFFQIMSLSSKCLILEYCPVECCIVTYFKEVDLIWTNLYWLLITVFNAKSMHFSMYIVLYRAWVSTGAAGAWHPPKLWTSPLASADFQVLYTNWHPQSSFYVKSGTLSFKFLTQVLQSYLSKCPK